MFEKIKNKPEHLRMRYLWIAIGFSMLFISAIWVFSLKRDIDYIRENLRESTKDISPGNIDIEDKIQYLIEQDKVSTENLMNQDNQN